MKAASSSTGTQSGGAVPIDARPVIFISAVSTELRNARELVAKTLYALGYEPRWQDIAAADAGDLRGVLRKWVDDADAVVQIVGHCYGHGRETPDEDFGPCSYTQYEALYARQQGKRVYYILTEDTYPTDGCGCEPLSLHEQQAEYRLRVKAYGELYHSSSSREQTELIVRRLKDELAELRKAAQASHDLLHRKLDEQAAALADLRQMLDSTIQGGSKTKLDQDYDDALRFIAQKRGITLSQFRTFLDENATRALGDPALALKDKVRALQEAGQFVQARDFALAQARRLEQERKKSSRDEVELWIEAAKTELTLGHYAQALEYAGNGAAQTDPKADFPTWAAARHQLGRALRYLRRDREAQALSEELIPMQQAAFGPTHLATLQSRRVLALSLCDRGDYKSAEQQNRALIADCERALGAEHPDTLACRNNLAIALYSQAKFSEAEEEYRAVLKIQERTLGAEHPDTFASRNNLAITLQVQGKHAEAEIEHRAVVAIQERRLGAEHPNTLMSRMNLANALCSQAQCTAAEQEHRAVLGIKQRVLGAEHPDTIASRMNLATSLAAQGKNAEAEREYRAVLEIQGRVLDEAHPSGARSRYNLALCLEAQQMPAEAIALLRRAEQEWAQTLGAEHPDTKLAKDARERIEAAVRASTNGTPPSPRAQRDFSE